MYDLLFKASTICLVLALVYFSRVHLIAIQKGIDLVSRIINSYLLFKYPITSGESVSIPTCPYRWPNGQGDIEKFLRGEQNSDAWARKHGRVYRIWSGMNPEIVLTDPKDVKTVFRDSELHLKGINNDAGWLMGQLLGKCLGLVSGLEWRQVRASLGVSFTHKVAVTNIPHVVDLVRDYFADFHTIRHRSQGIINPVRDLRLLAFWIIADYLYRPLTPHLKSELQDLIPVRERLFERVIQGGVTRFTWSKYLPTRTNRDLKEFKTKRKMFNEITYQACKLAHESVPVVEMYESTLSGSTNVDHFLQTTDEMLFGNLDVTVGGLSWNPLFLAANHDVQTRLREDIREAKGAEGGLEKYVLRADTLLATSILESARLKPVAPFSIPQAAPTTRVVGGFPIPAGTSFVVDTHALNIRNSYWGEDGTQYRPSRLLGVKPSDVRYQYWRFGFGPRQCLGKSIADLVIRIVVAHLVQNYELSLTSTSHWDKNPSIWITQPTSDNYYERLN